MNASRHLIAEDSMHNPAQLLRKNATLFPDKPALFYPTGKKASGRIEYAKKTYAEIERDSDRAAYALRSAGFSSGEKAVFMVKPGPELFVMTFALFKLGVIPVLVDPGMGIRRMLHCYKAVGAERFLGIPMANIVRQLAPGFFSSIKSSVTVARGNIVREKKLLQGIATDAPFPIFSARADEVALIGFTTGSTGPAKGVETTYAMAMALANAVQTHNNVTSDDVQLLTSPFFGLLGMMMGNTCVIPQMNPTKPAQVHAPYIIDAIEKHGVTGMFASPALLHNLGIYGEATGVKLPTLRIVSSGGAPMTLSTMKLFRKMLRDDATFETTWGATEGLPLSSINVDTLLSDAYPEMKSGLGTCIGKPVASVNVRAIRITQGAIPRWSDELLVAPGEIGELIVQGPNISASYHRDEKSNHAHKIHDDGAVWHRTGDLGWFDTTGRIWFCGRKAHQVKLTTPTATTLYSVQGEGVANSHAQVYRSAMVSAKITDDSGQETVIPVMCVQPNQKGAAAEQQQLRREILALMQETPATSLIKHVLFHPAFPVDIRHNAKVDRELLGKWSTQMLKRGKTSNVL